MMDSLYRQPAQGPESKDWIVNKKTALTIWTEPERADKKRKRLVVSETDTFVGRVSVLFSIVSFGSCKSEYIHRSGVELAGRLVSGTGGDTLP